MIKLFKSAVLFLFVLLSVGAQAADFPPPPNPFRYVNDYTKTLSAQERQYLENKLVQYGKETSSQIAVVIVPTTGEYDIAQYAAELGDKWGVGRKKDNNGVIFVVAKNDRKVFIATGQGLQGVLPDAFLAQVIRQAVLPSFKQGQYAQGINRGLDYVIAASKGEFAPQKINEEEEWDKYIPFVMVVIFILFVMFGDSRSRRRPYISPTSNHDLNSAIIAASILNERNRNRGGFGGGFGSGRFGGSSGGGFGGGGFDGGGAGGSW